MKRNELVKYLDDYLAINEIKDISSNGLIVEGNEEVKKIGLAVDSSLEGFTKAAESDVDFLIVHHGLYWGKIIPITGYFHKRLKTLMDAGISLYVAHLPLDFHREVGNNIELVRLLGMELEEWLPESNGLELIAMANLPKPITVADFVKLAEEKIGEPVTSFDYGKKLVQRIAICSGGAAYLLSDLETAKPDLYYTGERNHTIYHYAKELGINIVYGGHYNTETVGVKALGKHLLDKFNLPNIFIDLPTTL